jgi:DNA repair ATPase RecN
VRRGLLMNEERILNILKGLEEALNKVIDIIEREPKEEVENLYDELIKIFKPYQDQFKDIPDYEEENDDDLFQLGNCSSGNCQVDDFLEDEESNYDYCIYCGRKIKLDDRYK